MIDDPPETIGPRKVPRIPEVIPQATRCSICKDKRRKGYVDAQLTAGLSATLIGKMISENMHIPTSSQMILSHKKHFQEVLPIQAKRKEDLALLVVDRTVEAIKDGRLEPSISHGLAAQQIIDRRADKMQDRDVVLAMARVLSGAGAIMIGPPSDLIIDGHAEEIP